MTFKPMLSPGEDPKSFPDYFKKLRYPLLASPKYDGIRCIVKDQNCLSRSGKLLPSNQVQSLFGNTACNHFDGELIEGNETDFDVYNRTQSHVMSENNPGNLTFHVFDYTASDFLETPFYLRLERAETLIEGFNPKNVKLVPHRYISDYDELIVYENECLSKGFEGIMMRDPLGYYKQGRGTFKQGLIYKLKRFSDSEGVIIDFEERLINNNNLERDELGYAKRSSAKEGLSPSGMLGRFVVMWKDEVLDIAPGSFNHESLKQIWENRELYIGKILKFRYFNHGVKDKPRFPRAIGFREGIDL